MDSAEREKKFSFSFFPFVFPTGPAIDGFKPYASYNIVHNR